MVFDWKKILGLMIDYAIGRWPTWAGLFVKLKEWLLAEDIGAAIPVGAAPTDLTAFVVNLINDLADRAAGPVRRWAFQGLARLAPTILDAIWDTLFDGVPKPMMAAKATDAVDCDAVFAA